MGIFDHARARWRRFMGRDQFEIGVEEARRAAVEADLDFRRALRMSGKARAGYDTRPPPSDPPPALTLDALRENLDEVDQQIREALDDETD